jgi:hypothetical protein
MIPKDTLKKIVVDAVDIEKYKEYNRSFPETYSLPYDKYIIDDYIKKYPKETEELRKELIKKEYWLKYNKSLLEKKLRKEILPPLLKNEISPTGTQAPLDHDYDLQVYTYLKRDTQPLELQETKYKELDRSLESLAEEDQILLKMKFGMMPFIKEHKYVEIARFFIEYYSGKVPKYFLFTQDMSILSCLFTNPDEEYLTLKKYFQKTKEFKELNMNDQKIIMGQFLKKSDNISIGNFTNNAFLSKRVKELLVLLRQPLSVLFGETIFEEDKYQLDEETFNQFEGNVFF